MQPICNTELKKKEPHEKDPQSFGQWMSPNLSENPKYHVTAGLGHGGYSSVFLAECQVTPATVGLPKEWVAVKQVVKEPTHPEEIPIGEFLSCEQDRLHAEHLAANAGGDTLLAAEEPPLRVAGIKDRMSHGEMGNGGFQYLVLPLCRGGTLHQAQRRAPALFAQEDMLKPLARHLFQTVAWMHSLGVAHLDLKPENLLFEAEIDWTPSADGDTTTRDRALQVPVVTDFGLSTTEISLHGYRGTPGYVAKEVIDAETARQADPAKSFAAVNAAQCDVFALGVIIAELRSKRNPFAAQTPRGAIDNTLKVDKLILGMFTGVPGQCPSGLQSASSGLKDFLAHALHPDPGQRMTAAQALEHPWLQTA